MSFRINIYYFFFLIFLLFQCGDYAIQSKAGSISKATFDYFQNVYYDQIKDKGLIKEKLKELEVQGYLAKKLKFKTHSAYRKFLDAEKQARLRKSLLYFGRSKLGKQYSIEDIYRKLNIIENFIAASRLIYQNKNLFNKNEFIAKEKEIVIARRADKNITLFDLKQSVSLAQYKTLLGTASSTMAATLKELFIYWLDWYIDTLIQKEFNYDKKTMVRFDSNQVAKKFLTVKYYGSEKGMYPVKKIKVEFKPEEVYRYFAKKQSQYKVVKSIHYRIVVTESKVKAESFKKEYNEGKSFFELFNKFSSHKKYAKYNKIQRMLVTKVRSELTPLTFKKQIESIIISYAKTNQKNLVIKKVSDKFIVFRIENIIYENNTIKLDKYYDAVVADMTKEIIQQQYQQDFKIAERDLNFR